MADWYRVSKKDIDKAGGKTTRMQISNKLGRRILHCYKDSPSKMIMTIFSKDFNWDSSKFPTIRNFYKNLANRKVSCVLNQIKLSGNVGQNRKAT